MRKVRTFWLFLFILMLSSCEHKEFHYVSSRFYPLRVEFDWNRLTDHEKPEGMRVFFFPKVGTGEPWILTSHTERDSRLNCRATTIRPSA